MQRMSEGAAASERVAWVGTLAGRAASLARRVPRPRGVGSGLLLAFLGISAFVLLAAAAGIYGVRQVGQSLDTVDARIAPTLAAIEPSRSAERIVAAPALLAAADAKQRDEARARLQTEIAALNARLLALPAESAEAAAIAPAAAAL